MEVKNAFRSNLIVLALILVLLISSNSALKNEWHYIRNRRDIAEVMERDSITSSKAVNPFGDEVKKREKRFVFLLPLLPLFGGMTLGTAVATGAAVAGTAVVLTAAQNGPLQMPRMTTSYDWPTSTAMEASKPKNPTDNEPGKGKSPSRSTGPKTAPKADEITAFPNLKDAKPKTPVQGGGGLRRRWKDDKGKIYEWDSKKGEVEVYNKRGKEHEGGFDPYENPPKRISDPVPDRTVEP